MTNQSTRVINESRTQNDFDRQICQGVQVTPVENLPICIAICLTVSTTANTQNSSSQAIVSDVRKTSEWRKTYRSLAEWETEASLPEYVEARYTSRDAQ